MIKSTMFPFKEIEKKYQKFWDENNIFHSNLEDIRQEISISGKKKDNFFYVLGMLPYPSGNIHMGHVRSYVICSIITQLYRMKGYKTINPIGWDSFGLPAENAAIENGIPPQQWTNSNIKNMKSSLKKLGFNFSWDLEISTCSEEYYIPQTKLVIDMFEKGLLERKQELVNWDPVEKTVLANEQVINGKGWRSNASIEKKPMFQWYFKITNYAEELINSLDSLKQWPEDIILMQRNWIGKSTGAKIEFDLLNKKDEELPRKIEVFTTQPELIFGGTFIAISPKHPISIELSKKNIEIKSFLENLKKNDPLAGFFSGLYCYNKFNKQKIPLWVANYIVDGYGASAVYACPAHCEMDKDFSNHHNIHKISVLEENNILINSEELNGLDIFSARRKIFEIYPNDIKESISYRLQDWGISRQRIWGCPIPLAHCNSCDTTFTYNQYSEYFQNQWREFWRNRLSSSLEDATNMSFSVNCLNCKDIIEVEKDTLDTFVDSSWYFLRYLNPNISDPIDTNTSNVLCPVDCYIGGAEHAVLHLLYARFFTKALRDLNYINFNEPFIKLINQGMVCMQTFKDIRGKYVPLSDTLERKPGEFFSVTTGEPLVLGGFEKMSKSKKNGVSPDEKVDEYGADAVRFFIISDNPIEKDFNWNENSLRGCWKFLNRFWNIQLTLEDYEGAEELAEKDTIKLNNLFFKLQYNLDNIELNNYASSIRIISSFIEDSMNKNIREDILYEKWWHLVKISSLIIPHITEAIFDRIKKNSKMHNILLQKKYSEDLEKISIVETSFPSYFMEEKAEIELPVSVNSKYKISVLVKKNYTEDEIKKLAIGSLDMKQENIKNIIYIPYKIINIILK